MTPYGSQCHKRLVTKAEQPFRQGIDYDDGSIVEMVLWRVRRRFCRQPWRPQGFLMPRTAASGPTTTP
jgi:hypothetical protein